MLLELDLWEKGSAPWGISEEKSRNKDSVGSAKSPQ